MGLDVVTEFSEVERHVRLRPAECTRQLIKTFLRQLPASIHWFRDFGLQNATDLLLILMFMLFAAAQYPASLLWRLHVPRCSVITERAFDDLVGALLDLFPDKTEQQHVYFRWLSHRWTAYLSTWRMWNDLCWSQAVAVYNEQALRYRVQSPLLVSNHDFEYNYGS